MNSEKERLVEMIQGFDSGFLVTKTEGGTMHGRPMALAQVRDNGTLYFAADAQSPKVAELENDSTVGVFFQGANRWISLAGVAVVVHDRELIEDLWSETWKAWFPKGKTDPHLCLIEVLPRTGEYWDRSGVESVKLFFEQVKAYLTGEKAPETSHNAKIAM